MQELIAENKELKEMVKKMQDDKMVMVPANIADNNNDYNNNYPAPECRGTRVSRPRQKRKRKIIVMCTI